jgi:WD40 repeat protein
VASGRIRKSFTKARTAQALQFGPDRRSLAVSGNGSPYVQIWDTVTDKAVPMNIDYTANALVFSPDGKTLAGARYLSGRFTLWDVSDGKGVEVSSSASEIPCLAFSPDGKTTAVSNGSYWGIELRSATDGRLHTTLKVQGEVRALAFSPDGDTLVSADEKNIRLWHVPTRRNTATLPGDSDQDQTVTFAHDGQSFATTSGSGTTRFWTFR